MSNNKTSNIALKLTIEITFNDFISREQLDKYHKGSIDGVARDFLAGGTFEGHDGIELIKVEELHK